MSIKSQIAGNYFANAIKIWIRLEYVCILNKKMYYLSSSILIVIHVFFYKHHDAYILAKMSLVSCLGHAYIFCAVF